MFEVKARNSRTEEVITLGAFEEYDEAQWNIDHNIEWDEDDDPTEWEIFIEGDEWEESYDNLECGFDPYMGCYTDECQHTRENKKKLKTFKKGIDKHYQVCYNKDTNKERK